MTVNLFFVDRNRILSNSKFRTCLLHLIKLVSSAIWQGRSRRLDDAGKPIDYIGFHRTRSILLWYRRNESTDHNLRGQILSFIYFSISCSVNYMTNALISSLAQNRETSITPLCPNLSALLIKYILHNVILYTRAYNIIIICYQEFALHYIMRKIIDVFVNWR